MKTLVTGGAGFIGATTVQALLDAGHEVLVFDNLSKGYADAIPSQVTLVRGDVGHREQIESVLRDYRPEAVLHFAASIEAGESMKVPEKYFRNNSAATLTLLEAMLAAEGIKATGKGYNARVEAVLREALAKGLLNPQPAPQSDLLDAGKPKR